MKKFRFILFTMFLGLLVFGFTATDSFSQRGKEIKLEKNGHPNGYKVSEQVKNGKKTLVLQAINVIDPKTKKLLEGFHDVTFRCTPDAAWQLMENIRFREGLSDWLITNCMPLDAFESG